MQREKDATILCLRLGPIPGSGYGTPVLCGTGIYPPWTTVHSAALAYLAPCGEGMWSIGGWQEGTAICVHCARIARRHGTARRT